MSTEMCSRCPYGEYQTDKWQDQCIPCMSSIANQHSTNITGASSQDECKSMFNPFLYSQIISVAE